MRNPLQKALWLIGFTVLGVGIVLLVTVAYDQAGKTTAVILTIVGIAGLGLAIVSPILFLTAIFSAIGHARLMSGKGLIARWHVTADEWDRFRAVDKIRAAEDSRLKNTMDIREQTPPQGVDVIIGRGNIIVDGSYHSISGLGPRGREINWLNAPVDPECIEFPHCYVRGRTMVEDTLRVPVPVCARADGVRVFEHYRPRENPILYPTPARLRREGVFTFVLSLFALVLCGSLLALTLGVPMPKFLLTDSMRTEARSEAFEYNYVAIAFLSFITALCLLASVAWFWQIVFRKRNIVLMKIVIYMGIGIVAAGFVLKAFVIWNE
jgi:hypothetical protein